MSLLSILVLLATILTLVRAADIEGFTIAIQTTMESIPNTDPFATASNYFGPRYSFDLTVKLLDSIQLPNPTDPKTIQFTISGLFAADSLPTDSSCSARTCGFGICILAKLTPDDQSSLNNEQTHTISCGAFYTSISSGPTASLTAIITNDQDNSTVFVNEGVDVTSKFVEPLPAISPQSTTVPQIVAPNSDFTINVTFEIDNPPTTLTTDQTMILTLHTMYSESFSLTTCRIKGNPGNPGSFTFDDQGYASLGIETTTDITSISFEVDPIFLLPVSSSSAASITFYCIIHAPMTDSLTTEPKLTLIISNSSTNPQTITPIYYSPLYLPDIEFKASGVRLDFRVGNLQQWLLTQTQLGQVSTNVEKFLNSITNLYLKQLPADSPSHQSKVTQKAAFRCDVVAFERFFDKTVPYPGSTQGVYNVPSLAFYCAMLGTSSPLALAYMDAIYAESIANLWQFKDMLESSILWQLSHILDNIGLPELSDDDEDDEDDEDGQDGGFTGELVTENDLIAIGTDPTDYPGPVLYQNGTIYDNRVLDGDFTYLQLFRVGNEFLPTTCFNNIQDADQDEKDVDCGGGCKLCTSGATCNTSDEVSGCLYDCGRDGFCTDSHSAIATTVFAIGAVFIALLV